MNLKHVEQQRIGLERNNNRGELMKIILYNNSSDIVVEFQDKWKRTVHTQWQNFLRGTVRNPHDFEDRLYKKIISNQGCEMECIEYRTADDITVRFNDEYGYTTLATWRHFKEGNIRNPYFPSVFGVGMIGTKYPVSINRKDTAECKAWRSMLKRCYNNKTKEDAPTYQEVTCCDEWLLFENFYEWLHSQENFEQWLNGEHWALDKDILVKGNKLYSPDTCCLVPPHVNSLFKSHKVSAKNEPIGVQQYKNSQKYVARVIYGRDNHRAKRTTYYYSTPEDAFYLGYKPAKEHYIRQIAIEEYQQGNITQRCYDAMMNYEVEITD